MSKTSVIAEVPVLDLGDRQVPKGSTVAIRVLSGERVVGSLHAVDYRDGVAYTVEVWDGHQFRSAYVETVEVLS